MFAHLRPGPYVAINGWHTKGVATVNHPYYSVLYICMSSLTTSINLLLGLPLFLLPGGFILGILLPIYPLSLLCTGPNHLSQASLTLYPKRPTCVVPLIS
ncbi:hypothetical protein HF521_019667 [Silurus meridionalis]|uniref:Uncharacterized protein n=1 Tax=Silurus meridionalis TaxID=175797 RepID=A0A8T0BJV4_SILME|nr:hypothetical protein HF521_019667 [Silurus meridionalis]